MNLYENMTPNTFQQKLQEFPVAYLPLGTLEWHGSHLPLGTDMIISQKFFLQFAEKYGGIVLPPLFLGPDQFYFLNNKEYYGIDFCESFFPKQKVGSAYYIKEDLFNEILSNIIYQLSRVGFKFLIAHGHGPSVNFFLKEKNNYENAYNIKCYSLNKNFMSDHGGQNETSLMLYLCPELCELNAFQYESGLTGQSAEMATAKLGEQICLSQELELTNEIFYDILITR